MEGGNFEYGDGSGFREQEKRRSRCCKFGRKGVGETSLVVEGPRGKDSEQKEG